MSRSLRGAFRIFTFLLLGLTLLTAVMNVLSDDTEVRARATALVRKTAGCGEACRVVNLRGSRSMIDETLELDIDGPGAGHYVATCRRAFVALGDYACVVTK